VSPRSGKILAYLSTVEFFFFTGFSFFLIPLSFCPDVVDPGLSIHFCLWAALIAVLSIVRLIRYTFFPQEQEQGPSRILAVFFAGYLLTCLLSLIPSINKSETVFEIAKAFLFCNYFWFASAIIRRRLGTIPNAAALDSIAVAVMVGALVISLIGIFEYWGMIRLFDDGRVGPGVTLINRNLLSSYLFLCLGFVLFVTIASRGRAGRFLGFFAYAAILYMLLSTQTRAVWLGCLGGLLCTIIITALVRLRLLRTLLHAQKRIISVLIILPFLVIVAGSFFKPAHSDPTSITERAATIVDPRFESNNQRILLWRKTIRMSLDHPFLGVGAGNWKIFLPRYGLSDLTWPDMYFIEIRPYNDFFWVLAETGVLGLLSYGGLFFLCFLLCVRSLRTTHDPAIAWCAILLMFTLIGFAIISCFDFPKERVEHLMVFGVILAVCSSLGAGSPKPFFNRVRWRRHALTGASLVCAAACLWIGVTRLSGDINESEMRRLWQKEEWQKTIAAADRASSALYTMEPSSTPLRWYRGVANFKLGNFDQAFLDYQQAHAFHPWHLQALNDLGTCYSLKGDQKRAIALYSDALAMSPFYEPTLINLAAIYYNGGHYDSALCIINRCKTPHTDLRFESFFNTISQKAGNSPCP
jgi:O-antigen ligase